MTIVEAKAAFGANGQVITGQPFETVDKIMRKRMTVVLVIELGDLGAVEAIETIGGRDPEKALIVLCDIGDRIAAEAFGGGQLFDKMGNLLREDGAGEKLEG